MGKRLCDVLLREESVVLSDLEKKSRSVLHRAWLLFPFSSSFSPGRPAFLHIFSRALRGGACRTTSD